MEWTDVDSFTELCQITVVRSFLLKLLYETWIDKQTHFVALRLRHVTHDDAMRFDSSLNPLLFPWILRQLLLAFEGHPKCHSPMHHSKEQLILSSFLLSYLRICRLYSSSSSCPEFVSEMFLVKRRKI
jgi:hypothetical protein